ncbi:MAG: translation elongation factor Ts [Candidatus Marinamargulisbacteria bacterium]
MTITAALVKELREKTGVGMMACKSVLQETNGDIDAAIKSLREKGLSKAEKKSDRSTKEGRVITHTDGNQAVILELACETDFVANNDNFKALGQTIAQAIVDHKPAENADVRSLSVNESTVSELISDAILQLGENITVGQFKLISTSGSVSKYDHTNGKIGVVVEFTAPVDDEVGRDVAMQVAAMNPLYVSSDQVPASDLDNESDILRKQAVSEGKPPQVVEKIIQGRLSKFYKENCLVEQVFVKNPDKTIKELLPSGATVASFDRFSLAG